MPDFQPSEILLEREIELEIRQEPAAAGDVLMARDAEFLQKAAKNSTGPVLRFYEWSRPTVSLGFHQKETVIDKEALHREEIAWVRRPTGGAAVLHSQELTYALVLPPQHPFQLKNSALEHVGRALARGLRAFGVASRVIQRGNPLERLPDRASCFVRTSHWEVCVGEKKIVGSAQRVLNGALLQHGSILCGADHLRLVSVLNLPSEDIRRNLHSRMKAAATSIEEELGHSPDMQLLRNELANAFREEFNLESGVIESHA